jgi:hypothetical protein
MEAMARRAPRRFDLADEFLQGIEISCNFIGFFAL